MRNSRCLPPLIRPLSWDNELMRDRHITSMSRAERDMLILKYHRQGWSNAAIARALGDITRQGVQQAVARLTEPSDDEYWYGWTPETQ